MASILKARRLALTLIILIIVCSSSQTIPMVNARVPYKHARQLAINCNTPIARDIPGCGGGSGGGGGGGSSRPGRPSGPVPGSSRCRKGCCGITKMGECRCCQ